MLMRNTSFDKTYAMLLDKLSYQMVEISDLLIWSRERMINHEMNFRWVPDFRDPHLAEDFDGEGPSAVLSHGKVGRNYCNVSGIMDLLPTGSDANDFLRKG